MDLSRYNKTTQQLIREGERFVVERKPGALRKLESIKNVGLDSDDEYLLNIVYYYTAIWYYDCGNFSLFYKNLKEAIYHSLRTNDNEMLAKSYNLFGIYAQFNDLFEVAYSYYMNAKQFIGDDDSATKGIVIGNLSNLYYEMGDYKQAIKYIKMSRKLLNKGANNLLYQRNMLISYTSEGLSAIALKDYKTAREVLEKAQKLYLESNQSILQYAAPVYKFFEARLALVEKKYDDAEYLIDEIIEDLKYENAFEYITDISIFCTDLLKTKFNRKVGKIIESIEKGVNDSGVTHAQRLLVETKVDYYNVIHDEKALLDSLLEQHQILIRQKEEQQKIYKYSLELVRLIDELREEEINVRSENEILQIQALTDPLTNIPNRHALDLEFAIQLEKAHSNRESIGIEIMDVDDFKDFNDIYGHSVGDICLEKIGKVLSDFSKKYNIFCARYGGDEFVIIYQGMEDSEIKKIATELREAIAKIEIKADGAKVNLPVNVSQGICNDVPRLKSKYWEYLTEADAALYGAKEGSKKKMGDVILIRKLSRFYSS